MEIGDPHLQQKIEIFVRAAHNQSKQVSTQKLFPTRASWLPD
jgi:hypothetical protein